MDDIFLRCRECCNTFCVYLLTEDEDSQEALYCPFCGADDLAELYDDIDYDAYKPRPKLKLLPGGLDTTNES